MASRLRHPGLRSSRGAGLKIDGAATLALGDLGIVDETEAGTIVIPMVEAEEMVMPNLVWDTAVLPSASTEIVFTDAGDPVSTTANVVDADELVHGTFIGGYDFDDAEDVAVDAAGVISEANEANNVAAVSVAVLPDLVLLAEELRVLPDPEALPVVNITVHNEGLREATAVLVGVYDTVRSATTPPVVSTTVDVPAGSFAVVSLPIAPEYRSAFYLGTGWDGVFDDRVFADNLVLHGVLMPERCYLPLVLRR